MVVAGPDVKAKKLIRLNEIYMDNSVGVALCLRACVGVCACLCVCVCVCMRADLCAVVCVQLISVGTKTGQI